MKHSIPYARNVFFTGREELLRRIHLSDPGCVVLIGPHGIGKTQIALEYAYRYAQNDYHKMYWFHAPSLMTADIRTIIADLRQNSGEKILCVFDNIENLALLEYVHPLSENAHMLLTTCGPIPTQMNVTPLLVPVFSQEEAALFLLRRLEILKKNEQLNQATAIIRQDALSITTFLESIPAALEWAGAYMQSENVSLNEYFRHLEQMHLLHAHKEAEEEIDEEDVDWDAGCGGHHERQVVQRSWVSHKEMERIRKPRVTRN